MGVSHNNLTDPDLHEPKGASTASIGSVYVSDGAGSGSWLVVRRNLVQHLDYPDISSTARENIACMTNGTLDRMAVQVKGATAAFALKVYVDSALVGTLNFPSSTGESFAYLALNTSVTETSIIGVESDGNGTVGNGATVLFRIAESVT